MKLINAYIDYYLMTEEENVIVDYKYEGFINSSRVINDSDISNNGINPQLNQVDQNKQDIDKLKNDVKTNTNDIDKLKNDVKTNTNDIDKLKNDVKTNTNDIKNNTESLQKKEDEINQLNRFNSEMNEAINLDSYPESNKKYVNQQVQVIYNTPAPKITYDLTADFNLNKAN
jgi:chromosome segregation ATPase